MPKKITFTVLILISLIIAYNLIHQISDALRSGDRLNQEVSNLSDLQAKNSELKNKISEVNSDIFIEEQARNKLGLGKKGETVVIIPDNKIKQVLGASESAQEVRLPNWLGWWKVFFR